MTADAALAAIVPSRPAWRSLLWTVPFAILWTWLIYSLPVLLESGLPALAVRLMVHDSSRSACGSTLNAPTSLRASVARLGWRSCPIHALGRGLLDSGHQWVFRTGASPLPLLPSAIFLPIIIGAPLLLSSRRVGQLLDAMPTTWLVALQLYRVFGSQWLAYWLRGLLPGIWALPAGTGDVLTGLFAVSAAIALAAGTAKGRKAAILWNIFGVADLAVAITLGMIIAPGPFQLIVLNGPSIGLDGYPNVLTPVFVVPGSILLHALSLRQLMRRSAG